MIGPCVQGYKTCFHLAGLSDFRRSYDPFYILIFVVVVWKWSVCITTTQNPLQRGIFLKLNKRTYMYSQIDQHATVEG